MTSKEYTQLALRTMHNGPFTLNDQLHMVLGMTTESAEIADVYKKHIAYGKPLDLVNLKEELGDFLWFSHVFCHILGFDIDEIKQMNIDKLQARYPEKFTVEQALNRDLNAERKVLEHNN